MPEVESSSALKEPEDRTPEQSDNELKGMSLLEHLEELRRRIIYALIAIAGGFFACWGIAPRIFDRMQKPITEVLRNHHLDQTLIYLNPTQPFNLYLKVGLMAGLFVASPVVLYQVWAFIAPGLYRNERRYVVPFLFSTVALFVAGGLFGYFIMYPAMLNFLIEYGGNFKPMITIGEYMDLFMTVIVGLGIVFEMPILIFFLALMGVVSAGWLWRNLRYSILVIFIIAAILTPTTDIVNMCIFAAPMIALYLVGIGVAWLVHPTRRKARAQRS